MSEKEKKVFNQEVNEEELDRVSGGFLANENCVETDTRSIYVRYTNDGVWSDFPNCAATVEDGSLCDTNDACMAWAVKYLDKKKCMRAWE